MGVGDMGTTVMVLDRSPSFQDGELPPSLKGGVAVQNGPSKTAGTILKGMYELALKVFES